MIGQLWQVWAGTSYWVSASALSVFLQPLPSSGACLYSCAITTLQKSWRLAWSHSFWTWALCISPSVESFDTCTVLTQHLDRFYDIKKGHKSQFLQYGTLNFTDYIFKCLDKTKITNQKMDVFCLFICIMELCIHRVDCNITEADSTEGNHCVTIVTAICGQSTPLFRCILYKHKIESLYLFSFGSIWLSWGRACFIWGLLLKEAN